MCCAVAWSVLSAVSAENIGISAASLPGAHDSDNSNVAAGHLLPLDTTGAQAALDGDQLEADQTAQINRYGNALNADASVADLSTLVFEP